MLPIGLLILSTLMQTPTAKGAGWGPLKVADGSFFAEMPAEPKVGSREIPDPQGAFHVDTYTAKTDEATYHIQATRFSGVIPEATRDATFEREVGKYLEAKQGQVVRQGSVGVGGWPGWDMTLKEFEGGNRSSLVNTRCRIVLSAQTLYQVSVTSKPNRPLPESAGRFFRSFRFEARKAVDDATPEKALRAFLVAQVNRDDDTLDAVVLAPDGLDRLLAAAPLKGSALVAARKQAATGSIRVLKAGDEYPLPPGETAKKKVEPAEVAEGHALLIAPGATTATRLESVEGHWKVDAAPLVEARKAAETPRATPKTKSTKKPAR